MISTVEKVLFLKSIDLFRALPSEELAQIAEIAEEQPMAAGDLVFDKSGRLLLTTTNNHLIQVNPANGAVTNLGTIGYSQVLGLAVGSDGTLYGMSDATDQIFSINPIHLCIFLVPTIAFGLLKLSSETLKCHKNVGLIAFLARSPRSSSLSALVFGVLQFDDRGSLFCLLCWFTAV